MPNFEPVLKEDFSSSPTNDSTTEQTLKSFLLSAGTLANNDQSLRIKVLGNCASNGRVKQVKLYFGTAAIFNSAPGAWQGPWSIEATVARRGAASEFSQASSNASGAFVNMINATPTASLLDTTLIQVTAIDPDGIPADVVCEGLTVEIA